MKQETHKEGKTPVDKRSSTRPADRSPGHSPPGDSPSADTLGQDDQPRGDTRATEFTAAREEGAAGTENDRSGGVGRLKYAGVGPPRSREPKEKLTGADVSSLGSLEAELMGILWEIGQPATGMEVMEASLYRRRSQGQEPVSFATIATTLRRLSEKGVLKSEKDRSRTPVYTPLVGREEMAARILNNVSVTLLGKPLSGLLPKLLGRTQGGSSAKDAGSREEVERLLRALEEVADGPDAPPDEA